MTRIEDTSNVREIYRHRHKIQGITAHQKSPFVLFLANPQDRGLVQDIFLADMKRRNLSLRNLTKERFGFIMHFAISKNGDIVFTTNLKRAEKVFGIKVGIYFISQSELRRQDTPHATLLVEDGETPVWFPDGERIIYTKNNELFILTVPTGNKTLLPIHPVESAALSPDGAYIASPTIFGGKLVQIEIHSLETYEKLATTRPPIPIPFRDLKWSPDGKYLVYTGALDGNYHHVAIPFDKDNATLGVPVDILTEVQGKTVQKFVWASLVRFPVEPTEHLTTLWGKLKK
ncbi:hypothetical protein C6501_18540 [Candidatus Poribacteria bacterium]|nr:MAG: hypothetical protein C6501_18540 [Candidatus Poribacteria bacterium]